ncbi:hypothetical protein QBC35DRAFT_481858 [Podospora australis]|uniref:Secreted protein n=1 Tax=Podospora australis TaxID=1536484 RepID=A0AAN6X3R0_9PEZI|nr:hypothetical protein QBC35DRAFT_481858 [Podospora australis]
MKRYPVPSSLLEILSIWDFWIITAACSVRSPNPQPPGHSHSPYPCNIRESSLAAPSCQLFFTNFCDLSHYVRPTEREWSLRPTSGTPLL